MPTPAPYTVTARNLDPTADNKIHEDATARRFGFSGALVPGVELFGYLSHPMVAAFGADFLRGGRLGVRFRRPVYDGEQISAVPEPDGPNTWRMTLLGPEGEPRAVGAAATSQGDRPAVDVARYPDPPPPAALLPTSERLPVGPMGSVAEPVTLEMSEAYLEGMAESLPLYREQRFVHPGGLLRVVNALLMRNVALGPWIHTASECVFLAPGRLPATLRGRGVVRACYERNGHSYVEYDALVLADDVPVLQAHHTAIYRLAAG